MRNDATRLGNLCEFRYGRGLPAQIRRPGLIPVYGSNGIVGYHDETLTDDQAIIIGRKGSIGEVHLSEGGCWPIDTTYYVDRSATDANLKWLSRALANLRLYELNKAAAVPGLSRSDVYEQKVFVPSITEQRRITAILDKVDALRRKRKRALELIDNLVRSLFSAMFGDADQNHRRLPVVVLGDIIADGPSNGLYKPASTYGRGTPILRINNFYAGEIVNLRDLRRLDLEDDEITRFELHEDDIVINRVNSREYVGKSAIVPALNERTVYESNMMRLRVESDAALPRFIIQSLQSSAIRRQIISKTKEAINQVSINQKDVRSLQIVLPTVKEQELFVKAAGHISALRAAQRTEEMNGQALFASIQHRAFTGQL